MPLRNRAVMKTGALIPVPSQRIIATIVIRQNGLKCYAKMPCAVACRRLVGARRLILLLVCCVKGKNCTPKVALPLAKRIRGEWPKAKGVVESIADN
jgi:hypothetical protein